MFTAGIDEAGRGAILGPLVIGCVTVDAKGLRELKGLGVRDSKKLAPSTRERLVPEIIKRSKFAMTVSIPPVEIDKHVHRGKHAHNLNWLEAFFMASLIDKTDAPTIIIDCPDTNVRFYTRLLHSMVDTDSTLRCRHYADRDYTVVGAASILAKVERDVAIQDLNRTFGLLGSGYPSDPTTRVFLRDWLEDHEGAKPYWSRKNWSTWKDL